jgi:hypothetical protein
MPDHHELMYAKERDKAVVRSGVRRDGVVRAQERVDVDGESRIKRSGVLFGRVVLGEDKSPRRRMEDVELRR